MHVTATQGTVSYDIKLTRVEAEHLKAILDYSAQIWQTIDAGYEQHKIERTSGRLFRALDKLAVADLVP
jgi:outer membrane lipoprotein-sorting protein